MKNKLKNYIIFIIILFIVIAIYFYLNNKTQKSDNTLLENKVADNKDTDIKSQVPKGTFRNTETGEIFSYVDNNGYLVGCQPDCKSVYFDVDTNGNIIQIKETGENPIIGKIYSSILDKNKIDTANYLVEYNYNGKVYKSNYLAELCHYFKGGGKQCYPQAQEGTPVIVLLDSFSNYSIDYLIIFNKILKAELIEIINVDHI